MEDLNASAVRERPVEEAGVSLADFAYGRILDRMLSGELKPGQVLQERRLAEVLGISRTPVREALGRLEAEQLVSRRQGRMLVVAELSVENYVSLLDMRRILEVEVSGRATGRITPEALLKVEVAIIALRDAAEVSTSEHWDVDDLVHNTIAEAAGNPMIVAAIRDLRRRTHLFNTARISHRRTPGAEEHLALIRAVAGDDPERSRDLMGAHLDHVRDAIIDYILGRRT